MDPFFISSKFYHSSSNDLVIPDKVISFDSIRCHTSSLKGVPSHPSVKSYPVLQVGTLRGHHNYFVKAPNVIIPSTITNRVGPVKVQINNLKFEFRSLNNHVFLTEIMFSPLNGNNLDIFTLP